ncbi:MAG: VTT domain-containing protein [Euryarchaeota archaeon]|nr:VTT domain-containing protein [Euryarchaeota archaeon]
MRKKLRLILLITVLAALLVLIGLLGSEFLMAYKTGLIKARTWSALFLIVVVITGIETIPFGPEVISISAAALGFNFVGIAFIGGFGSVVGSLIDYFLGFYFGKRILEAFFTDKLIQYGMSRFKYYGIWALIGCRLIPFIPAKPFFFLGGTLRMPLTVFSVAIFVSSWIRYAMGAYAGSYVIEFARDFSRFAQEHFIIASLLSVIIVLAVLYIVVKWWMRYRHLFQE